VEEGGMAKETLTRLVDDLDGGVAHETVRFGLDGHQYEIDLSTKNAKKLRSDLAAYVEHATRISARAQLATRRGGSRTGRAAHPDHNRAIREWAAAKGYDISQRGRIKQEIVDEFHRNTDR
jgi:hypothetical protein